MTVMYGYGNQYRGYAQPARRAETVRSETPEEKRRRLHREAAEAVKRHAAALREAKARYHEYDAAMAEATKGPPTTQKAISAKQQPKQD